MPPLGDLNTLIASRHTARKAFEDSRGLSAGSKESADQISHAEEVAKFLRENVVQGESTGAQDNYSTTCWISNIDIDTHANLSSTELRIHEHTERGDNEDIKKGKGKNTLTGTKCCSS